MSYASFVISSHVPNECEGACEKSLPKKTKQPILCWSILKLDYIYYLGALQDDKNQ